MIAPWVRVAAGLWTAVVTALASPPTSALELIRCNAMEGRTLYATFGRIVHSGDPKPIYYPIELVIFSEPQTLQERIIFPSTEASLKVRVFVADAAISFRFRSTLQNGLSEMEAIELHLYSPKNPTWYVGKWKAGSMAGSISDLTVYCSVY